jgi:16S rRNA (cytosine1402-N4)-methyltransferase
LFLKAFETSPALRRHHILALDQDPVAVSRGRVRFKEAIQAGRLEIIQQNFGDAGDLLAQRPVLGLLADLGFSSDQLEDRSRGLSFQWDGPLDMRLNPEQGRSCLDLLRQISEFELEKILRELGEERFSKRIAAGLIESRRRGELPETTKGLVDLVVRATPKHSRHGKIHVATRTFQALRIAVNQEMEVLDRLLEEVVPKVIPGGRVAVISFHSLEDRIVKQFIAKHSKDEYDRRTPFAPPKPMRLRAGGRTRPSAKEIGINPRSRSAIMRVAFRTETAMGAST